MTRKAKLEKALANYNSDDMFSVENYKGAQIENARLAPLHEALIEAVDALEYYNIANYELRELEAEKALFKLDKALEGMGGK